MKKLVATLRLTCPIWAQVATITGRFTDAGGAVIPAAGVIVRSVDTGIESATATNNEGLQPGRDEINLTRQSFVPTTRPTAASGVSISNRNRR